MPQLKENHERRAQYTTYRTIVRDPTITTSAQELLLLPILHTGPWFEEDPRPTWRMKLASPSVAAAEARMGPIVMAATAQRAIVNVNVTGKQRHVSSHERGGFIRARAVEHGEAFMIVKLPSYNGTKRVDTCLRVEFFTSPIASNSHCVRPLGTDNSATAGEQSRKGRCVCVCTTTVVRVVLALRLFLPWDEIFYKLCFFFLYTDNVSSYISSLLWKRRSSNAPRN